jgi:hypothetical protein
MYGVTPSIGGDVRPEPSHRAPHLIFANVGSVGPLLEPDPQYSRGVPGYRGAKTT